MSYGVFNDSGLLDGPYDHRQSAEGVKLTYDQNELGLRVSEICPDHEYEEAACCEECFGYCSHDNIDDDECVDCGEVF